MAIKYKVTYDCMDHSGVFCIHMPIGVVEIMANEHGLHLNLLDPDNQVVLIMSNGSVPSGNVDGDGNGVQKGVVIPTIWRQ